MIKYSDNNNSLCELKTELVLDTIDARGPKIKRTRARDIKIRICSNGR